MMLEIYSEYFCKRIYEEILRVWEIDKIKSLCRQLIIAFIGKWELVTELLLVIL